MKKQILIALITVLSSAVLYAQTSQRTATPVSKRDNTLQKNGRTNPAFQKWEASLA